MEGDGGGGIKFTDGDGVLKEIPEHFCQFGPLHRLISKLISHGILGKLLPYRQEEGPKNCTNKQAN